LAVAGAGLFVGVLGLGQKASAQTTDELRNFFRTDPHFFQWDFDDPSQASGNAPAGSPESRFMVAPKLNNSNYAQVDAILRQSGPSNPNFWQGIVVQEDLTSPGALGIFYLHRTTLTFADLEPDFGPRTRNLANQQAASAWSRGVHLGNFDLLPPNLDVAPQLPMLNPSLYPGSPGFGDPASGAVNTRTGLFMAPIRKLTGIEANNTSNLLVVPWATRFNNWGNDAWTPITIRRTATISSLRTSCPTATTSQHSSCTTGSAAPIRCTCSSRASRRTTTGRRTPWRRCGRT